MLSGNITVSSNPGEYTTFTLSLPEVSRDLVTEPGRRGMPDYPLPDVEDTRTGHARRSRCRGGPRSWWWTTKADP